MITTRCLDCHSTAVAEGDMDLEKLLSATMSVAEAGELSEELTSSWLKVEAAIEQNRMPPTSEDKLSQDSRQVFRDWFRSTFVLKDGKPHIGPTPLRRLTNYEFLNSLEDLLGVTVRAEYNFLSSVTVARSFAERVLPAESPGESGFVNDASALASQKFPLSESMKCVDLALAKIGGNQAAAVELFGFEAAPKELSDAQVRQIAQAFLHRALRGKSTQQHVDHAVSVYRDESRGRGVMPSLKAMLRSILLQPEFYYRLETSREKSSPYSIDEFEFATRLSYFLNCSTPDDELLAVAESGTLRSLDQLDTQIERLLNKPRRLSLSERFAAQWIGFDELVNDSAFDASGVPTANRAHYDEMLYSFDELFRSDRSILELVDSDWAYVSRLNLKAYGSDQFGPRKPFDTGLADVLADRRLTGAQRRGIERIYDPPTLQSVVGDRYGGVVTSGAVMRITSAPERTSPVRRGVWLLDKIIGEKLEAPKNVPPIENAVRSLPVENPSKLQIIKAHTEMESCAVCHKSIDPLGFGLENFDSIGRWRTEYRDRRPIDSQGILPGGKPFSSPRELRQQLLEVYREPITRNFIRRLLAYAIGRSLQPYDRVTIDEIYDRVVEGDYRTGVVIREIIHSPQFQSRQD